MINQHHIEFLRNVISKHRREFLVARRVNACLECKSSCIEIEFLG
jgi:hypothetical protein